MFGPVSIEHHVDEVRGDAGELLERYVFWDYRFELAGAGVSARAYQDEAWRVALRPAWAGGGVPRADRARALREVRAAALRWLSQRFDRIDELGAEGYAPIWLSLDLPSHLRPPGS